MNNLNILFFDFLILVVCAPSSKTQFQKPNIVFIMADDMGWADLSVYANQFNEAPRLTQMAGVGIRFTDAYALARFVHLPGPTFNRVNTRPGC